MLVIRDVDEEEAAALEVLPGEQQQSHACCGAGKSVQNVDYIYAIQSKLRGLEVATGNESREVWMSCAIRDSCCDPVALSLRVNRVHTLMMSQEFPRTPD